jgi:hypothetical protein
MFDKFETAVAKQFDRMLKYDLFRVQDKIINDL